MKHLAAGAHLPKPWLVDPTKWPDDRTDYCLYCSFLPQWKHQVLVFTLEWSGARPLFALWANSDEGSAQSTLPFSNAD